MSCDLWLAFFAACWVISLSPGAGAVSAMSSGLQYGFRRGYWNVIGLQLGLMAHILIVAAGVGAILAASEPAFNLIKWFGVGYLLYLAVRQWRQQPSTMDAGPRSLEPVKPVAMIGRGFLVNFSNPKSIVFMLAVLPQFLDPNRPLAPQYGLMMLTMIVVDMIVMAGYTGLAVRVLSFLTTERQQRLVNRSFAGLFAGAASLLSLVHRNS